jgi:UDP-N-acetylmuramyl pentapeptide phosphotransferase/UDP-N-acetylglucosamine-1-phosphate transferase
LACSYPIFETLFTIVRRLWANSHPGQPDSHHLHSLVKVAIAKRVFPTLRLDLRNSSVSPFSWSLAALPAFLATRFASMPLALGMAFVFSFGVYLVFYWYLASTARRLQASNKKYEADEISLAA